MDWSKWKIQRGTLSKGKAIEFGSFKRYKAIELEQIEQI